MSGLAFFPVRSTHLLLPFCPRAARKRAWPDAEMCSKRMKRREKNIFHVCVTMLKYWLHSPGGISFGGNKGTLELSQLCVSRLVVPDTARHVRPGNGRRRPDAAPGHASLDGIDAGVRAVLRGDFWPADGNSGN